MADDKTGAGSVAVEMHLYRVRENGLHLGVGAPGGFLAGEVESEHRVLAIHVHI